ncbi:carboxylesterase/lipase family protein [Erwinia sp. V71]|uniref:carboxylesterase/lipase family protein n=1 Tax=Erwinia sp. V71 TaxID=3369424 RepID=UPI003F6025A4
MKKSVLLVLTGIVTGNAMASESPQHLQVDTTSGTIQGSADSGVRAWLGIPFAQPPVGELRWQPPQPAKKWQGVKNTTQYGKDCLQRAFDQDAAPSGVGFSEDCLTVNVWRPDNSQNKLPVMVWIYGGGFVNGGASPNVYSGKAFAREGVVFVSFNYRVGRFGFFAHPALADAPLRGNYGLMDQLAALKWVQENIAHFGGDASNVTVFGESAGGMSVNTLLTTPLSNGLFQKAIIQSGSGRHNLMPGQSWQQAEQYGIRFAEKNGIKGNDAHALAALRQLPADKVVDGLNMANMFNDTYSGPLTDGKIITGEPEDFYNRNTFSKVPLMVGANVYEVGFPTVVHTMDEALSEFKGADKQQAAKVFAGLSPQDTAAIIAQYKLMNEPARFVAKTWARNNLPVWSYTFGYVAESMRSTWKDAHHASEIPYVFNTLSARFGTATTDNDHAVAKVMNQYWVNFARTGNPNGKGLPEWQRYHATADNVLFVPKQGAAEIKTVKEPRHEWLNMVEKIN